MITEERTHTQEEDRGCSRRTRAAPGAPGPLLAGTCLLLLFSAPAWGVIRDGGVDPANLGKGGWIHKAREVTDPDSTFAAMKANGFNFVTVKAGTADPLWTGSSYVPVTTPNPVGVLLSSALVQSAHRNGLFIFGSNRTGGDTNGWPITPTEITNEVKVADYVFNQGADGFIWDAEDTWENGNPGLGANGPTYAWWLAAMVRAHWPTKFLGFNSWDTLASHPSLPYKEFAYWSDCAMPMVYNHSGSSGNRSNVFATILWCDVNYRAWQDALRHSNSVVNGQTIYWTNAIKPLLSCTGGNTTVYADQTTNAGNWSLLGRFNFAAGTSGSIRVTDSILESGRVAMVDGLKMVLAVPNRPHLDGLEVRPGGEVRLHISGCPGYYSIEAATTFGNWSELTNLITTTHCFQITLPPPGQPSQFYRAKLTR